MPLFAHGINHAALDGSPTGPADGDPHLVVAGQTVELPLQLPGISSQLFAAETEGNPNSYKGYNYDVCVCVHPIATTQLVHERAVFGPSCSGVGILFAETIHF